MAADLLVNELGSIIEESKGSRVIWIVGTDAGTPLFDTLKRNTIHALEKLNGTDSSFDYSLVITARADVGTNFAKLQRSIADAVGLLDDEEGRLRKILESEDELNYYRYLDDAGVEHIRGLQDELAGKIYEKLVGKRYLLVLEDFDSPIIQNQLTMTVGLPRPDLWNKSWWLITTPSTDICNKSKSDTDLVLLDYKSHHLALLYLIYAEASYILNSVFLEDYGSDEDRAQETVINCLFYCLLFSPDQMMDNSANAKNELHDQLVGYYGIQEKELVKYWIEAGITTQLTNMQLRKLINNSEENQIVHEEEEEEEEDKVWQLFETSKTILEEFINRYLLLRQHYYSPPHGQDYSHHPSCIVPANVIREVFQESKDQGYRIFPEMLLEGFQQVLPLKKWGNKRYISFMKAKWMMMMIPEGLPPKCLQLTTLKHLHVEHCSRLEKIFPDSCDLPSLETLTIQNCDSLTEIFFYPDPWRVRLPYLGRLHSVVLLELPKLLHFNSEEGEREARMPQLKTLKVRGCWRLNRLPFFVGQHGDGNIDLDLDREVVVSGEPNWWNKLTWNHYDAKNHSFKDRWLRFKPQPQFVSSQPTVRPSSSSSSSRGRRTRSLNINK